MRALRLLAVTAGVLALAAAAGSSRAERQSAPVPAAAVAAGLGHTCALTPAGRRRVLGLQRSRRARRRADARTARRPSPCPASQAGVTAIAEGLRNSCAITTRGRRQMLGRDLLRRARRRNDHPAPHAGRRRRAEHRREGDLGGRRRRLCSDGLRRREMLGLQLPGPARRRDVDRPSDAGRRVRADERCDCDRVGTGPSNLRDRGRRASHVLGSRPSDAGRRFGTRRTA